MAAAAPDHNDIAEQQMSVRELMRLDTALALEKARAQLRQQQSGHAAPGAGNQFMPEGSLKLLAIYGVGKRLLAEVMVGEQTHLYIRGRAWAVGSKAGASAYRLQGLSESCVQLARGDEAHTLCLHSGLRSQP